MSSQRNESTTIIANIYGGTGGPGGIGGVTGGAAGTGEGPTVNIKGVQNMTNNIVNQGYRLEEVLEKWSESPPDTKDRQYHLQSLHHKDTGSWLLGDGRFTRWKATPGALWINGISGTGKSVLSSTVIREIIKTCPERSAVAFFYFDFRNERQQRMDIMLRSIIWQLSKLSSSPYGALHRLYEKLGNGTIQPQCKDLQEVLEDLLPKFNRTYIFIDGLDECNKADWKPLFKFIHSLCHPAKHLLHLLFTSQPLEEFKKAFKDVTVIELGSAVTTNDIKSYVSSKIPEIGNWASDDKYAKDVIKQIVQKSNGMFRMASCLLIELYSCDWEDDWDEILAALPADLFGIYDRFLTRGTNTSKRTVFIQAILRWLMFSAIQITVDELADAVAFRLDDLSFNFSDPAKSSYHPNRRQGNSGLFRLLEGLIIIKENGLDELTIELAHSSVKDYILSLQFHHKFGSRIDLTKSVSHRFITQNCVRYLLLFADAKHLMNKNTLPDYPFALYAAQFWFHHLQLCNDQDQNMLLPLTICLLEDGSSQHAALYQLRPQPWYRPRDWDKPIIPVLVMCSEIGYTQAVCSLLIEQNTSANITTEDGKTALHVALEKGHPDIAKLLIEHNASVDLATGYGETALHLALKHGHLDIAQLLIEHNASIDLAIRDGRTSLHLALEMGHLNIVQVLIEHNVSVNITTEDGRTALHVALEEGHPDIAKLLIEHNTSVDLATGYGETALHLALKHGHLDIAQLLIEHNASLDLANRQGETALHLALKHGHLDIAQLLIKHNASVDLAMEDGWTALHLALKQDQLDIAQLLIKHNASVDLATEDGWTALHLALKHGHLDIAQLLIEHNASVNLANKDGETALYLALNNGHLAIAQVLIEHNASVNLVTRHGRTALYLGSKQGFLNIAQLLIKHNASVDLASSYGETALHIALYQGHLAIAQLLIKHNASVDPATLYGETALHLASRKGQLEIVQLLIKHNASVNLATDDGKTALDLALKQGHSDIAQVLIKHGASRLKRHQQ